MSTWSPPLSTRIGFRQLRTWSPVLSTTAVSTVPLDGSIAQAPAKAVVQWHGGAGPPVQQGSTVQGCSHARAINPKSPRAGSPMNSARKTQRRTQVGGISCAITQCPTPMRTSLGGCRSYGSVGQHARTPVGSANRESAQDLANPHPRSPSPICRNAWQYNKVAQGVTVCPPQVASPTAGAHATACMHHSSTTPSSTNFIPHTSSTTPTFCKTNSAISACGSSLSLTPGCTSTASTVVTVTPTSSCPSKPTNSARDLTAAHLNTHLAIRSLAHLVQQSRNVTPAGHPRGPPSSLGGPPPQSRDKQQDGSQTKRPGTNSHMVASSLNSGSDHGTPNSLARMPKGMVLHRNHLQRALTARTSTPSGTRPVFQRGVAAAAALPPAPPLPLLETSQQGAVHSLLPISRAASMDPPLLRVSSLDAAHCQARLVSVDPLADTIPSLDVSFQNFQSPERQDNRQNTPKSTRQQEQLPDPAWKRLPSPDRPRKRLQSLDSLAGRCRSQVGEPLQRLRSMDLPLQLSPMARRCSSPVGHVARSCSPLKLSPSRGCPRQSAPVRLHSAPQSPQRQLGLAAPSSGTGTITSVRHRSATGSVLPRRSGSPVPPPGSGSLVQGLLTASTVGACRSQCGLSPQSADNRVPSTPVASCKHRASPSQHADDIDLVDQVVWQQLMGLDQDSLIHLKVRRLGANRYELDGRNVILRWGPRGDGDSSELFVREEGQADWVPLQAYIQQAANVASALKGRVPGVPAVARIPQEKRLTFGSPGASDDLAGSNNMEECLDVLQRCASMRKACEEAKLRERAAEAYEHGLADFSPGPNQCPRRIC